MGLAIDDKVELEQRIRGLAAEVAGLRAKVEELLALQRGARQPTGKAGSIPTPPAGVVTTTPLVDADGLPLRWEFGALAQSEWPAGVLSHDQFPEQFAGKTKEELDAMAWQLADKFAGQTRDVSLNEWQEWKRERIEEFNAKWERKLAEGDSE